MIAQYHSTGATSDLCRRQSPVVVAVRLMRVVQMSTDQVVAVIAVRDRLVAALTPMVVVCIVVVACVRGRTTLGVITRDVQTMLVHMAFMSCVQMAVVQVVYMVGVADFGMGTARTMLVRVIAMRGVLHKRSIP